MPCHVSSTSSPEMAVQSCVSTCGDSRDPSGTFRLEREQTEIQIYKHKMSEVVCYLVCMGEWGQVGVSFISLKVDYVSGRLEQRDGSKGRERGWIEHEKEG